MRILLVFFMVIVSSFSKVEAQKLIAFGDSLTAGYNLPLSSAFPTLLSKALGEEVHNAGVSGDTTASGLARLEWSLGSDTKGVILELGANDALRGLDPALARANLEVMIVKMQARGIKILLAGMYAPKNNGDDYERKFNAIYPELASKYGLMLYPFFLDGVAGRAEFNQRDGIHPTHEGVVKIVENILPIAREFVKSLP